MTASRATRTDCLRALSLSLAMLLFAGCAGEPPKPAPQAPASTKTKPPPRSSKKPWKSLGPYTPGGLYAPGVSDGAPDVPPDIASLPEPVPHLEPLAHYGNRSPYVVLGKSYNVLPSAAGYVERGMASWYGTKFDGRVTSSLEPYDLTQFSAAHRTLPLPSYARVTNLENGRSVIVRINDRGPFHEGRLIDLSYAAAIKLGVNVHGTAMVEVRGIDTGHSGAAAQVEGVAAGPPATKPATVAPKMPAAKSLPATATVATPTSTAAIGAAARNAVDTDGAATSTVANAEAIDATADDSDGSSVSDHPSVASNPAGNRAASADTVAAATTAPASIHTPPQSASTSPAPLRVAPTAASTLKPPAAASMAAPTIAPSRPPPPAPAIDAGAGSPVDVDVSPSPQIGGPAIGGPAVDPATPGFLQLASYGDRGNAERLLQRLQQAGIDNAELVSVQVAGQTLWRVHVGPLRADAAADMAERLHALGFGHPPFFKQ